MTDAARAVQRVYLVLTLHTTLAASFIWGGNTLFLLDAVLSKSEAFAANAFFGVGQVVFEVPTGVVADTHGRRLVGASRERVLGSDRHRSTRDPPTAPDGAVEPPPE